MRESVVCTDLEEGVVFDNAGGEMASVDVSDGDSSWHSSSGGWKSQTVN